ncbi:disease resistance protein RGA2-like [Humulus lupulus]|uniref:disease resistance protein RGA2-like n=1 Tax=Humulus lupulus TaxID=3486 RepID=UPI002B416CEF|nr:disease resistance protein RGA2-like [Humulus lupulus]XP_062082916.1 disease resistance protein RGA2-like [Humulus lupulus]XP_062082917.1 disease resistance protein RGA2-like [Humulus lupulus]XP_062082918.1 disease resistance protein RGA2-like [Humulus lupulus]XP_062082919.1 disease resistance protein RGA2-like [Humulus lupulus]
MSEGFVFSVTDRIISWLGSAAVREIGSLWGLEKELQGLEDTLSTIKAVLLDAEDQHVHNRQVKDWLERLEDTVFMADDVLDEFSSEVMRQQVKYMGSKSKVAKKVSTFFSTPNQIAFRLKMANKINSVRKILDKIAADRRDFHFQVMNNEKANVVVSRERDTHSFVIEENVVGRDGDRVEILKLLLDTKDEIEENVMVIPIVGIGGLGKTTLAQLVFNDEKVHEHFDLKLWVCVANDFDVKLIVEKIIKAATNTSPENLEMGQLQNILHKEINRKKYLLVLDDVWNENSEKWHRLKDLLINGAKGSRIIVTSRIEKVAKLVGTIRPYRLETLDPDKSWSLFKKLAFVPGQESSDSKIFEMGMKIVKKFGGVPLAIIAVGRMLYFKNPEREWSFFVEKELSKISQDEDNTVLQTLKLSYDHLPSHLKNCFAYCSLFPKYHKIDVKTLINLWMAQGFIKASDPSECLDEIGHEYFMELLSRSFIQEDKRDDVLGDILTCKMHDLMHELAISIAGTKCIMLGSIKGIVDRKARHFSFDFNLYSPDQIPSSWTQAKRIRSTLLPCQSPYVTEARFPKLVCDMILLNFKFLRMLDFNNMGIEIVPQSIGDLKHLRYLDLSGNGSMRALPKSVIKLVNLQTLKLNYCYNLEELPRGIKNLINLKHLEIYGDNKLTYMPNGLGKLTNLQTLSQFVLSRDISSVIEHTAGLNELAGLNNLQGRLEIRNLRHGIHYEDANFKDKQHLRSLILFWENSLHEVYAADVVDHGNALEGFRVVPSLKEMRLEYYKGVSFPSWFPSSFSNLVIFELFYCVNCQNLPPLDQFHSLKILKLGHMPALEYIMNNYDSSTNSILPSLCNVELFNLPKLNGWWRDVSVNDEDDLFNTETGLPLNVEKKLWPSFPRLSHLSIDYCPNLSSMPLFPLVEECLKLINTSLKPFHQTLMNVTVLSASSVLTPLSKLKTLFLGKNEDMECLPNCMKNLTSLKELSIRDCPELKCLFPGLQHLSSLQLLELSSCNNLDISNGNAIMWHSLRSLRSLSFFKLPKLVTLVDELQHVTTLQRISIWGCYNFMALPEEWIWRLTSLRTLCIWECPTLTSLPESIRNMSSLQILSIHDCPSLLRRCQREIGQDWHKIAHIPHLDLRSSSIADGS